MEAYKREKDAGIVIFCCVAMALIWPWRKRLIVWLASAALTIIAIMVTACVYKAISKSINKLMPEKWDEMTGLEFERQIAIWLKAHYKHVSLTDYYDSGIDAIAASDGEVIGVQIKRATNKVGVAAVRAAVTGLKHYGCNRAMVVTNSSFTNAAIKLANENNCILIDGSSLRRNVHSALSKATDRI